MMAVIIFVAIGVGLGLYFTVPVLIPATLTVVVVTIIRKHLNDHAVTGLLLAAFGAGASLQIGFFLGSILRSLLPLRRNDSASDDVGKNSMSNYINLLSSSLIE